MFKTHKLVFKTKQKKCPFCNCNLKSSLYLYELCVAKRCKHKVCFTFEKQLLYSLAFAIDNYEFYVTEKLVYIYKNNNATSIENVFNFEFPLNLNKIYDQILNCLIFT